jgi:hypothetical protein
MKRPSAPLAISVVALSFSLAGATGSAGLPYHDDLVQAVGMSSTQLRSDLTSGRFFPPGAPKFSASDGLAAQAILRGDVHAATLQQLREILVVEMVASLRSSQEIRSLAGLDHDLRGGIVNVARFTATAAVKRFVLAYDHVVNVAIENADIILANTRTAATGDGAMQRLIDDLLAPRPSAVVQTDLARTQLLLRELAAGVRRQDQLGSLKKQLYAAAAPLVTQVNNQDHPEVARFVAAIKAGYPGSVLNDILVKRP